MPCLQLALLGPLHVTLDEQPVVHFGYDKVPALLAYLAVEADRSHTRDELAALLWPDSGDDAARRSLRVALTKLRQAIGDQNARPPFLLIDRQTIQFNVAADHSLDIQQFGQLLATVEQHTHPPGTLCSDCATHLMEAVALYRGELLEQVHVRDSVVFEEWVTLVREQLHQRAVEALSRLMIHQEQQRDHTAAEHFARRLLALEPWDEAAHRCLMRLLAGRGQRNAALAQYERCRRILDDEFGAAPAPETIELYHYIRADGLSHEHGAPEPLDRGSANVPQAEGLRPRRPPKDDVLATSSGFAAAGRENRISWRAKPSTPPDVGETLPLDAELVAAQPAPSARNRRRMLEKVRTFWIDGALKQSLHEVALIELGLTYLPEAVARPWDLIVRAPDASPRTLPPDTPIIDVFDEMHGELLILGAPGSGKTTLLLELAGALLKRAERDASLPLPVVFNLSSWAAQRLPLAEWQMDELHERYQVPQALGQEWIASEQVLPLLDGLDEVVPEHRTACVAAINAFRAQHWLLDLVVCSRSADYALLDERLRLQGAVKIQPLTQAQIDTYLAHGGTSLAAVRACLQEDAALRELADTPLMLNIMALAYRHTHEAHLQASLTLAQRRAHLFQTYVRQMLRRREPRARYTPQQTLRWLAWLARAMVQHSQSMLLIERIQPEWLPTTRQRWYYAASVGAIVGMLFGTMFGCFGGLKTWLLYGREAGLGFAVLAAIVGALVAGLVVGEAVAPDTRWRFFGGTIGRSARNAASFGVIGGAVVGVIAGSITGNIGGELTIALYTGLLIGLIAGVLVSKVPSRGRIVAIELFHWSWAAALRAVRGHLMSGLVFGLVAGTALSLAIQRASGWASGLANGVGFGLTVVLATAIVLTVNTGLTTSEVEVKIVPNQGIRRSARHMAAIGLAVGALIGLVGMLANALTFAIFAPGYPLGRALVLGLLYGPTLGLAAGLFYGGLACIQHALLRLHLWASGAMPLNYAHFLDYAAERVLLRKVGGRYMFVHRLLLEHFAALDPEAPFLLPPDGTDEPRPNLVRDSTSRRHLASVKHDA